jgi:hypothetical protein
MRDKVLEQIVRPGAAAAHAARARSDRLDSIDRPVVFQKRQSEEQLSPT